ncbi:DNA-3-methyladenine glycosylase family protein [Oceanicella actignis]|uniref:DNA-3-methyladenine glycosylase II n=1 Tax=Oceanicella actignis TaxID=1189325 RepID=A0A1M7SR38_9RHOB|nr:DNA-3-methyladenine glycosylase [Oceanicella actignis]TYO90804.1 DNA-3-methyladenine glycosylase II [Oceanicella actignis]SES67121.1 DNA-3-methyladenine glycosylase II [Oceanicella actignis]SHN60830.1 DNA-3-methyladenine glycosylase II [Oceanicella actignis]
MSVRVIKGEDCIREGAEWLAAREPRFAHALEVAGLPPTRLRPDGFPALVSAIVSQQLSVAAANGILGRLRAIGADTPEGLMALDDEALRACGLSRPKIRYLRGAAEAGLDFAALRAMPDEEAAAALVALKGVGRWTAEIYLMFSLGRADVFAPADLALQEASRALFDLPARPAPPQLAAMAEAWSPWRAVAARLLWAYYRAVRNREGIT